MAKLAPISAAELDRELADIKPPSRSALADLHTLLIRATPLVADPPYAALAAVARQLAPLTEDVAGLAPRPRTAFRLIEAGAVDAAWVVLVDNATGVVDDTVQESTSSGASRKAWPLPLLTRIEPPTVFADLPGFRDPRFGAPDECYDITDVVRLRHHLDEVLIDGGIASFGGWAALDSVVSAASDQVRLIATNQEVTISADCRRLRRADLVDAKVDPPDSLVWAGWSAQLDLADPRLVDGDWDLSVRVEHNGIVRRTALANASDLARVATDTTTRIGSRSVRWKTNQKWRLVVSGGP